MIEVNLCTLEIQRGAMCGAGRIFRGRPHKAAHDIMRSGDLRK
jgi:hypothetical protein